VYSTPAAIDDARQPALSIEHNFITIARTKKPDCELHYFGGGAYRAIRSGELD
jgi:hypothetical protein